ncbi:MAG: D-glycero-beta-D-manno-heptose-7-phosphate kinase [Proteobacteria bacterium]|nr:D-glycero-beta-D-manno-heptose-7-phosphate kinase [Pseudomonadota bacterium]
MTDRSALAALAESLQGARVLVIGDVMLDRFVTGDVERISPEAPIPVLRVSGETAMPGGAGNVVRNLRALGAKVSFVAVTGDDDAARELASALKGSNVTANLIKDRTRPTSIKIRYVAGNQQMLRADWETGAPLAGKIGDAVLKAALKAIGKCDAMVLSDYDKGVLGDGRAAKLIAIARAAKKPVIVDPKGSDYRRYRGADAVTPNKKELRQAAGGDARTDKEITAAARTLIKAHKFGAVLVTRSADGMTLVQGNGKPLHLAAETREVFDVSGAGDTVVATIAAAIAAGAELAEAAALANVTAGIVVGKVGTAVAYTSEVVAALLHQDISDAEAKVRAIEAAEDKTERWHRQGLRIGFTNGCFDLLHPGHVSLLRQARSACDKLIVGLNSDESVRRLKGAGRPIQNEAARATVLASLSGVDMVVIFGDDTPLSLIKRLRPDVLVKGADYKIKDVVGAELIKSWGGHVKLARLEPGHSTTATVKRLKS